MNEADVRAALLRIALGEPPLTVPERATWARWAWLARIEGAVPLLFRLVETVPTDLDDAQRAEIRQLQGAALSRCVQLEYHLLVVASLLREHGIRCAVLKGGATAHLDYPDPSRREVNDIDLLVDPSRLAAGIELLEGAGWEQGYPLPRGHVSFTHAVTFVHNRMELDLHQRVGHRALGVRIPTGELLDRAQPFEIAGVTVHALHEVDRLIHSAIHALCDRGPNRKMSSLADIVLAVQERPHLASEVLEQSERWRVRPLVERGVLDAHEVAGAELPAEWSRAMSRTTANRDRLVEWAYLDRGRRPVLEELAYLRLLGWGDRWRYVRGYFATDPDYVDRHGREGAVAQARYVLTKLRSRLS